MSDLWAKSEFLRANPELLSEIEGRKPAGTSKREGTPVEATPNTTAAEGAALVREIESFVSRFVVVPKKAVLALSLWVMGTHCFDLFEVYPYLAVVSPTKRCGKTRLTEVLEFVVSNPFRTVSLSEAALFRLVDAENPTLILDEAEVLRSNKSERSEAIRALLNAGYRYGVKVPRCVGKGLKLEYFTVYCPKVLCTIGNLPDTIRDRSIVVSMQRRRPEQRVDRFLPREVRGEAEQLRNGIRAVLEQRRVDIDQTYQGLNLPFLEDRDAEIFEPLFALMLVVDSKRVEELRLAAEGLTALKQSTDQDDSLSLKLLADMREIFGSRTVLASAELVEALRGLEESPWQEMEFSPRKLARMLRPFGVQSRNLRVDKVVKGYAREDLEAAWSRYL